MSSSDNWCCPVASSATGAGTPALALPGVDHERAIVAVRSGTDCGLRCRRSIRSSKFGIQGLVDEPAFQVMRHEVYRSGESQVDRGAEHRQGDGDAVCAG